MRLSFNGTWLGDANSAKFAWGRTLQRNRAGVGTGFQCSVNCSEVAFRCYGQADASLRVAAIEAATAGVGDLVLFDDSGNVTAHSAASASTFSGVRCTGLQWSDRAGAQMLTWRSFSASFEWETMFTGGPLLTDFSEAVTVSGGAQVLAALRPIDGSAVVVQQTVPATEFRAVQEGSATGLLARPTVPGPVFSSALLTGRTVTATSGQRSGANYRDFGIRWRYEFLSALGLIGVPNEWVG